MTAILDFFKTWYGLVFGLYFAFIFMGYSCDLPGYDEEKDEWETFGMPEIWRLTVMYFWMVIIFGVIKFPKGESSLSFVPDLFMRATFSAGAGYLSFLASKKLFNKSNMPKRKLLAGSGTYLLCGFYPWIPRNSRWWWPCVGAIAVIILIALIAHYLHKNNHSD